MHRLIIIPFILLFFISCEDSDSLFGPPGDVSDNIFDHINHYRLLNGVNVLESNDELVQLAYDHSQYMMQNNVVSHDGSADRYSFVINELDMVKYSEIVANGKLYGRDLIEKWASDDQSNIIILGDFEFIGVSVSGRDDESYATIIFAK